MADHHSVNSLLIAGIFALYGIIESRKKATDISKLEKSIAVLPFRNDSPDSTNSYFINGLMERITSNLQSIKELRVISRTSVEKYRNIRTKSILDIAEDLGVNYIVEGSGQKLGNSLSITTQLLRAKGEESHLWAKTYDQEIKETKDIFRIQSEIAQSIASQLKAVITPDEKELIKKIPTSNLGAYDLVLRGSEEELIFWNDNFNKQALFRAERYYREALKLDSTLAMAYSHLAAVCIGKHADVSNASLNYLDSSLHYANQALSFDDQLSDAYFIRGDYYFNKLIPDKAVDEYNLAIRYDPNNTQAYLHSGWNYAFIDPVKSLEAINTAVNLSHGSDRANYLRYLGDMYGSFGFPEQARSYYQEALIIAGDTSLYLNKIAQLEFNSGNFEKAFEFMQKVYLRDTTKFENKAWLAFSYYLLNQYSESLKYLMKIQDQLKSIDPFFIELPFNYVGHVYKINGFTKEADFWLEKQKEYCEQRLEQSNIEVYHYGIAAYYAIKGDKNKMYKNLTEFSKLKICDQYSLEALNYPYFGNVSNEPEFQKIINGLKTKYRQSHDRIVRWLEKQGKL